MKPERKAGDGWSSWIETPTSLSVDEPGVLEDAKVAAKKLSDSIEGSCSAWRLSKGREQYLPVRREFFSGDDNAMLR